MYYLIKPSGQICIILISVGGGVLREEWSRDACLNSSSQLCDTGSHY